MAIDTNEVPNIINAQEKFKESQGGVDLTSAEIIISIGRGIGKEENISLVQTKSKKNFWQRAL